MFDYFISLGFTCPVASSMSKYGLRSFSGVFDWLITPDFGWVLHYIETDFKDFLLQENLERYDEYPLHFRDKQSGFRFLHETVGFESRYGELKEKYDRRIGMFLEKTASRVCYLRSIAGSTELEYIKNNAEYIKHVIRKHNRNSEIVFLLVNDHMPVPAEFGFRYFRLPVTQCNTSHTALRSYFDHADSFLDFCGENYNGKNIMKNMVFDFQKEKSHTDLVERRYQTLTALLSHDFSGAELPGKVMIYRAGIIGRELYKSIRSITLVSCFIDKYKAGSECEGIKVIPANEIPYEKDMKIIVSASYDFENIREELSGKYPKEDIISLDDILDLQF